MPTLAGVGSLKIRCAPPFGRQTIKIIEISPGIPCWEEEKAEASRQAKGEPVPQETMAHGFNNFARQTGAQR